jgi:glycosyltransferase involved in cell wall biosynthesis
MPLMPPTPLISVVLPAFNSAPHLAQSLDSILAQTLDDFELLIIYDESSDQTRSIIESYMAKDGRVRLIEGQKARLVGALNQGIAASRGKYIARMDADDVSLPTRFERQVQAMDQSKLDFCGCDIVMMDESGHPIKDILMPQTGDLITITLACTVPFAHGSVMMRKAFLDQHDLLYQKGASAEDYDFWCGAYALGARFGNIREPLFHYRHFSQSLSKVHAKVVGQHTQTIRRKFVKNNTAAIQKAITRLLPTQKQLSERDAGFLLLAAYLLYRQNQSTLVFSVLKNSSLKNIAIGVGKLIKGF